MTDAITIETPRGPVSGLLRLPEGARAMAVVAHGAGVAMDHPLMAAFSDGLEDSGMASLRFNFKYTEDGRKAPDPEPALREVYRAAYDAAASRLPDKPLYVCGKSMGGRIGSMLVAYGLPAEGLVFVGYPLHPPGKFDRLRSEHLGRIRTRMLFLQGSRDPFARPDLLEKVIEDLLPWARLHVVEGGDHSCVVRGQSPEEAGRLLGGRAARFIQAADR
ncbi:MAG: dienelactone hydrolase [Actinobacteria bacterium]|nr:dienelactone hydrolase [Actinomycetota bacterium]